MSTISIGGIELKNAVMNAACSVAKSPEDIRALADSGIGVVTIGSITPEPRDGNPEPRWYSTDNFALNSFGMPNEGLAYYQSHLPDMITYVHDHGAKVSLSIAGFNERDYLNLATMATGAQVDFLELNLGCPNVQQDGKQKPIASFDRAYIETIVKAVAQVTDIPLLLKLSPYSNPAELQSIATLIASLPKVAAVVTCNTFANGYLQVSDESVLGAGFGGVSGKALLPIGLGQVRQFRALLPETIAVIGVGGIQTKADAEQYFSIGASCVQAASLIVENGHEAIGELL